MLGEAIPGRLLLFHLRIPRQVHGRFLGGACPFVLSFDGFTTVHREDLLPVGATVGHLCREPGKVVVLRRPYGLLKGPRVQHSDHIVQSVSIVEPHLIVVGNEGRSPAVVYDREAR